MFLVLLHFSANQLAWHIGKGKIIKEGKYISTTTP